MVAAADAGQFRFTDSHDSIVLPVATNKSKHTTLISLRMKNR